MDTINRWQKNRAIAAPVQHFYFEVQVIRGFVAWVAEVYSNLKTNVILRLIIIIWFVLPSTYPLAVLA